MKWKIETPFSASAFLGTIVWSVIFSACSSIDKAPIQKGISNAEMVITSAQTGDVDEYAPLELRLAKEKLQEARSAFNREDYTSARYLAEEAILTAELAHEKARAEKTKAIVEELRQSIEILEKELMQTQESPS